MQNKATIKDTQKSHDVKFRWQRKIIRNRKKNILSSFEWMPTLQVSQFSLSVKSDSLQPQGLQHARLPCPSPTPAACSNSCPSSEWCHPVFNLSQHQGLFKWVSGQSIRWSKFWSFSFSISPSNEYSGLISFRMDWLDLLAAKGLSRVFSNSTVQKHQFFSAQLSLWSSSHIHTWLLEKP